MKRTLLSFVILCVVAIGTNAQQNFVKGFFVNTAGDTVRGYVNSDFPEFRIASIDFKTSLESPIIQVDTSQFISLFVDGMLFEKKSVVMDVSPFNIADMIPGDTIAKTISITAFFSCLLKSEISLFQYIDESNKEHFFIQKSDSVFEELVYKQWLLYIEGRKIIVRSENYKLQLQKYFVSCPSVIQQVVASEYEENSMLKVFKEFNKCRYPQTIRYIKSIEKYRIDFLLSFGGSLTLIDFTWLEYAGYKSTPGSMHAINPTFGLGTEIYFTHSRQKASALFDVQYRKIKGETEIKATTGRFSRYSLDVDYVMFGISGRYYFKGNNIKPFCRAGITYDLLLSVTDTVMALTAVPSSGYPFALPVTTIAMRKGISLKAASGIKFREIIIAEIIVENNFNFFSSVSHGTQNQMWTYYFKASIIFGGGANKERASKIEALSLM